MTSSDDERIMATYCPACFCNAGSRVMPPHVDKRGKPCAGEGDKGIFLSQISGLKRRRAEAELLDREKPQRSDSVRALRGGLPGQGRRG